MRKKASPGRAAMRCMLCLLLALGLAAACAFALPPQYDGTYLGEMPDKMALLEQTPGRRIIVVGGSSVPFALKSGLLDEAVPGFTAVDFGLYAEMGTAVMLDWALSGVRAGDLVVVAPEQNAQALSCRVDGEAVLQAAEGRPELLALLRPERLESVTAGLFAFAGKKLRYTLAGSPQPTDIYARSSFNERGDIDSPLRSANIMPGLYREDQTISFSPEVLDSAFAEELNRFARSVRERGAETVYHFCPMNEAALAPEEGGAAIDEYYEYLSSVLDMPILGDPHRCVMPAGWFFDSNFHLNDSGAVVFTRLLAEDIKVYLRDTTPTASAPVDMPAPVRRAVAGDDRDEDCFAYEWMEDGWRIVGVTERGCLGESLTIPATHDGAQVTAVEARALEGCAALRRLTVQENIAFIPDGLFRSCARMSELVLTSPVPSATSVGDGLMDGVSFRIAVPAEAADDYRRSYFWQKYEAWIVEK